MLSNKLSRKSLGIFIIAGFCVLAIAGTVMGDVQSDTTDDVDWRVEVSSLDYDGGCCTDSYHQYTIENNSDLELKYTFEFSHEVYQITIHPTTGAEIESFVGDDTINQEAPPGADTLDNGESDTNWWWNHVTVSHLSGMLRIKAYTQLRVRSVKHGSETHLFSTPKANETYDFIL